MLTPAIPIDELLPYWRDSTSRLFLTDRVSPLLFTENRTVNCRLRGLRPSNVFRLPGALVRSRTIVGHLSHRRRPTAHVSRETLAPMSSTIFPVGRSPEYWPPRCKEAFPVVIALQSERCPTNAIVPRSSRRPSLDREASASAVTTPPTKTLQPLIDVSRETSALRHCDQDQPRNPSASWVSTCRRRGAVSSTRVLRK